MSPIRGRVVGGPETQEIASLMKESGQEGEACETISSIGMVKDGMSR